MEEIKREIKKNPRNNNENTTVKNLWDTEKSVLRGSLQQCVPTSINNKTIEKTT